jgi:GNAT superfamily N-acetyltransferase
MDSDSGVRPSPPDRADADAAGQAACPPASLVRACPSQARSVHAASVLDLALRPVTGSHLPAVAAMWQRCTLATRIARFHAPVRHIPASYLKAVLDDPAASVMAQHESTGDVVALASLIRSASRDSAELGVLVEDAWQRRGIGRRVVTRLIAGAPSRGITAVEASVLAENAKIADLLRQVPGDFSLAIAGPALKVRIRLPATRHTPTEQ